MTKLEVVAGDLARFSFDVSRTLRDVAAWIPQRKGEQLEQTAAQLTVMAHELLDELKKAGAL